LPITARSPAIPYCKTINGAFHSIQPSQVRTALPRRAHLQVFTQFSQLALFSGVDVVFECCCILFKEQAPELLPCWFNQDLFLFTCDLTDLRMEFCFEVYFTIARTALLITPPADAHIPFDDDPFAPQFRLSLTVLKTRFRCHSRFARCIAYILIKTIQFYRAY